MQESVDHGIRSGRYPFSATMPSPFNNKVSHVKFIIRNSLQELPEDQIFTRTCNDEHQRSFRFQWHVHLDVISGNPAIIARVEVDMGPTFHRRRHYVQNRPRKVFLKQEDAAGEEKEEKSNPGDDNNGDSASLFVWRCFESKQKCWGWPGEIWFTIVGIRGTILKRKYDAHGDRSDETEGHFCEVEDRGPSHLEPLALPSNLGFQVQLLRESNQEPLSLLPPQSGEGGINFFRDRLAECSPIFATQLVHADISITSAGSVAMENIRKVALNFIKYEAAIDEIVRRSREHAQPALELSEVPLIVKSNLEAVPGTDNKQKHDALMNCKSIPELIETLCPMEAMLDKEKYKLAVVEDSGNVSFQFLYPNTSSQSDFLQSLIRFSVLFCHNSMRFQRPTPLRSNKTHDEQIDFLFENVIRDRFVEEALRHRNIAPLDADQTTMMDLSDCMDGLSLPETVVDNNIPLNVFCNALYPDSQGPDRKRPRGGVGSHESSQLLPNMPVDSAVTMGEDFMVDSSASSTTPVSLLRPMFRHYVADGHNFTSLQLTTILKKLSITVANQKSKRLQHLDQYFGSRSIELQHILQLETPHDAIPGEIWGIELLLDENSTSDSITMILRGGRKASRLRVSVDSAKPDDVTLADLTTEEIESVCSRLGIPAGVAHVDAFLDSLQAKLTGEMYIEVCRFALVHDLPCKV